MTLKKQLLKLKDNWLLVAVFVLGMIMVVFLSSGFGSSAKMMSMASYDENYASPSYSSGYGGYGRSYTESSLVPDVLERIVVKTASMSIEVKDFDGAESSMKSFVKSNNALLTYENVNTQYSKYRNGYYTVNVPVDNYDALVSELKGIGEVKSFNENANDITGSYLNLEDLIDSEVSRLESYEKLYNSTSNVDDKIALLDRIYDQKNTIKSLELQKSNQDERITYSQVTVTLQEKRPTHANVVFASLADLWSSFKASLNVMLYIVAYVLPFVILGLLIYGIRRYVKKH